MATRNWVMAACAAGVVLLPAQELFEGAEQIEPLHAECTLFGPKRESLTAGGLRAVARNRWAAGKLTADVVSRLAPRSFRSADTTATPRADRANLIDRHLFSAMEAAGVKPAPASNDYEFVRRVTFDLTGRPPSVEKLVQFVADTAPDKRTRYIDQLIGSPEFVDKWTMFLGDLYENVDNNTQVNRFPEGRNAFHNYLKKAVETNKRYNVLATELITATGGNSWTQGELNWIVGGRVTGGPVQDIFDQQAANVAEKFLGLAHLNCILCHDGRRHMEDLSLWGKSETRRESWQLAAFFSKTTLRLVRVSPTQPNPYYWSVEENPRAPDYALNTTTGNRPARQPIGSIRNIAPEYPFADGGKPAAGENYRVALARFLTADIQFSRAIVNYVWKQFFVRGLVEPANQFDLDRLDPNTPPAEPWTLQPSNPALLEALARDFQASGFDLRDLMRKITTSEAYQLSARYEGSWQPEYEKYYARKLVRRLWAEEIHDAIAQISGIVPRYNVNGGFGQVNWAMQLPQTSRLPGEPTTSFLDSFIRGNRVDEERKSEGSVPQALNMMNDSFVHSRTRATGTGSAASLVRRLLDKYPSANNSLLVNELFLTILNRPPSDGEMQLATASLAQGATALTRQQKAEDLAWALFNKVDFLYNY